eukprot:Gb_19023 [translate_table: standard]
MVYEHQQSLKVIFLISQTLGMMKACIAHSSTHPQKENHPQWYKREVYTCIVGVGKVLLPVFALGRAQELCILLDDYWERMNLKWALSEKNLITLPGYCVDGTIGHKLTSVKATRIELDKRTQVDVCYQKHQLSFSAHMDAKGIIDLIKHVSPRHVVLVHGEKPEMALLKARISSELGIPTYDPANIETVDIPSRHAVKVDLTKAFLRNNMSMAKEKAKVLDPSGAVGNRTAFYVLEDPRSTLGTFENQGVLKLPCGGSINGAPVYDTVRIRVYIASTSGRVTAINLEGSTFNVLWSYESQAPVFGSLDVDSCSGYVLCSLVNGNINVLSTTGTLAWLKKGGGPIFSGPCISTAVSSEVPRRMRCYIEEVQHVM